jgi:hypothetical protein
VRTDAKKTFGVVPDSVEVLKEPVAKKPVVSSGTHNANQAVVSIVVKEIRFRRDFHPHPTHQHVEAFVVARVRAVVNIVAIPSLDCISTLDNPFDNRVIDFFGNIQESGACVQYGIRGVAHGVARGLEPGGLVTGRKAVSYLPAFDRDNVEERVAKKGEPGDFRGSFEV